MGQLRGRNALLICGIQAAVADILHHGSGKQMCVLQHHAQAAAQSALLDFVDVDAIVTYLAICNIIKAVEQVGNGGFAGPRAAYKGNFPARGCMQADIMKNHFSLFIPKIHIMKGNIPFQLLISYRTVRLMRVFPCPDIGAFAGFAETAIGVFLHINQFHITVIHLRFLVQQIKNSLCTRHGHDNAVHLLADLANRLSGILVQGQKGNQRSKCQAEIPIQRKDGASHRTQHIADVAKAHINRHGDIGKSVGLVGAFPQLLVEPAELLHAFCLMAEHLNHFLPFHHLLNITVDSTQVFLLLCKIGSGFCCNF